MEPTQQDLLDSLRKQLAEIEENMKDETLSHSDQELMDQAWEDITNQIEEIEDFLGLAQQYDWKDAQEFFDEEDEAEYEYVPVVTYAPPPPTPENKLTNEEIERFNAMADLRSCEHCASCSYCFDCAEYVDSDEV
jgi:hypothetical protein